MKKLIALLLAVTLVFSLAACGNNDRETDDSGRIKIIAFAVQNGVGYDWLEHFAEEWNDTQDEYFIETQRGQLDLTTTLKNQIASKTNQISIYFGSQSEITQMVAQDMLIDLSDVYDMKVDGNDKGTIGDKTIEFDLVKTAYSDLQGNGIYAVPYATGMAGLIFDYDQFLDNGWLVYAKTEEQSAAEAQGFSVTADGNKLKVTAAKGNYEAGDYLLSASYDGKYGTYDDGQVTTLEDYNNLIAKIIADGCYPYIYNTKSARAYLQNIYKAHFAQYLGKENYYNLEKLDGTITGKDGTVQATFTPETGLQAYSAQAVKDAYENALGFYVDNIYGGGSEGRTLLGEQYSPNQFIHKRSYQTTSLSHIDAQGAFVTGPYSDSVDDAAFLLEGVWFEKSECINTINGLVSRGAPGYLEREFRFYLLPPLEGQIGDIPAISVQDDGCGVLVNYFPNIVEQGGQEAKDKYIAACKDFIAYTLRDEALAYFTETRGIPRPFIYDMTDAQLANMSPFQRSVYEMSLDDGVWKYFRQKTDGLNKIRSYSGFDDFEANGVLNKAGSRTDEEWPGNMLFTRSGSYCTLRAYLDGIETYMNNNYQTIYQTFIEATAPKQ